VIGRLNHVAIAVPDLAAAARKYRELFGADVGEPQALPEHGVTVVFVPLENTKIELMQTLGADSPIAKFMERNPGGAVHHICYEVPDIASAAKALVDAGARILGGIKTGAHGLPVLFLHPKDFDGTLIELEEVKPDIMPA
jgi:methylmalonyl-CoA/ethylmalonyl-CoA epimerase